MKTPRILSIVAFCALLDGGFLSSAEAQVNVLTYHYDNTRSGLNSNETILNPTNVNANTFGKLFSYAVDGYLYAQPLYVDGMTIPGQGVRNVLFLATENNSVYAIDADNNTNGTAGLYWHVNLGTAATTPTTNFGNRSGAYNNIEPLVGITSTPVINLATGTIYVVAYTQEESTNYFYHVHALNITNGLEQSYSPVQIVASMAGLGVGSTGGVLPFVAKQEIQRAALTLAGGNMYVAFAGFADTDPYHGWVLGYNASNLQLPTNYIFNTTPNSTIAEYGANAGEGGIWLSGCGLSVDSATNVYFQVGNGIFNATNGDGDTEFGDSFMKLSTTNGYFALADYFTPFDEATLQTKDLDVGSGGLLLLPDQPGTNPHLMVGGGKQGWIYLIDRDQMTSDGNHFNYANSNDYTVQRLTNSLTAGIFSTPAYFNGNVYFAASGDKLKMFTLTNGVLTSNSVSTGTRSYTTMGTTPIVTANGTNNGIIWATLNSSTAVLVAYNATNLTTELYNSSTASGNRDKLGSGVKFATIVAANGKVYAGNQASVTVFGLLGGTVGFSSSAYSVQQNVSNATITVNRQNASAGAISVSYTTVVPGGTAANGVNYSDVTGTLNWASGDATPKTFSVPIIYDDQATSNVTVMLQLSGPSTNTGITAPSVVPLTIQESPYAVWRVAEFGANANNPSIAGDLADPSGDGEPNLLAYAIGWNPNVPNTNSTLGFNVSGNLFQLTFNRNTSAADLTYVVQVSSDLNTWTPLMTYTAANGWAANIAGATASEGAPTGTAPNQTVGVSISDSVPLGSSPTTRFFQLSVQY